MQIDRRKVAIGLGALPFAGGAAAQAGWPVPQVTLVVPFPPGGSTDALARLMQPGLQQRIGATVIIENKAGASGAIGAAQVARARPDGSTFLVTFDSHAVNPSLQPLTFDTEKDLEPVMLVGTAPYLIACHPSRSFKTFADVVAAAKQAPGKVTYASVGAGTIGHLAMTMLAQSAGVELAHVPYRGGGPAMNDAVAGHVDMICGSVALVTPQVAGGGLRPLMQTGSSRASALATVPTAKESGFADFEALAWWGVFAPKDTPKELAARMGTAIAATLREPQATKVLTEAQQIALQFAGPADLATFLSREIKTWGDVVRRHGIKAGN